MSYFNDKARKFTAYVRSVSPKNKKKKQSDAEGGGDAGTKPVIMMTLDIPITAAMQKHMSPEVQSWVEKNKNATEPLEKTTPKKESPLLVVTKFFDENAKEPAHEQGREDDRRVTLQVQKYFLLNGEAYLQARMVADFDKALWGWVGGHITPDEQAIQLETKALQKVLPFGREEKAEDEE